MTLHEPTGRITHIPGRWQSAPKRPSRLVLLADAVRRWWAEEDDAEITASDIIIWLCAGVAILVTVYLDALTRLAIRIVGLW